MSQMTVIQSNVSLGRFFFLRETQGGKTLMDLSAPMKMEDDLRQYGLGKPSSMTDSTSVRLIIPRKDVTFQEFSIIMRRDPKELVLTEDQICKLSEIEDFKHWCLHVKPQIFLFVEEDGTENIYAAIFSCEKDRERISGAIEPFTSKIVWKASYKPAFIIPFPV